MSAANGKGGAPAPLTYERSIIDAASCRGWAVTLEGDFLRVSDGKSCVRHGLRGPGWVAYSARAQHSLCRGDKP
jgi:hypothetical protein